MNPIYTFTSYTYISNTFNVILHRPMYAQVFHVSVVLRFYNWNFVYISRLYHTCYTPSPSHPSSTEHPSSIWLRVQIMNRFLVLYFFILLLPSSLLKNTLLSTQSSNTLYHFLHVGCEVKFDKHTKLKHRSLRHRNFMNYFPGEFN
jgi:L-asparagine transporter-like permease